MWIAFDLDQGDAIAAKALADVESAKQDTIVRVATVEIADVPLVVESQGTVSPRTQSQLVIASAQRAEVGGVSIR